MKLYFAHELYLLVMEVIMIFFNYSYYLNSCPKTISLHITSYVIKTAWQKQYLVKV